ncbi:Histone-lysine N-methyltransferase SETMAR [Anthophora plagiata]
MAIATSLLSMYRNEPFLDRLITGDEKWGPYENVIRKRQGVSENEAPQAMLKANLREKRILLYVWWGRKGIIHYELLPRNETVTAALYVQQLARVQEKLEEKRPALVNRKGVMLLHDNARPHTARIAEEKIPDLKWSVLLHPPYSPDLVLTDNYLFRFLQSSLSGKKFNNNNEVREYIDTFIACKDPDFFASGVDKLPDKWEKVIFNNGDYILD